MAPSHHVKTLSEAEPHHATIRVRLRLYARLESISKCAFVRVSPVIKCVFATQKRKQGSHQRTTRRAASDPKNRY